MTENSPAAKDIYGCLVIGGGAAGLFFAAGEAVSGDLRIKGRKVILEKTPRPGQKILMSGGGSCNITHAGPIKDFVGKYGEKGRLIRTCLYRHNNLELMEMLESLGVPLTEQSDGRVFPASMKASDILEALLSASEKGGWEIRTGCEVTGIEEAGPEDAGQDGGLENTGSSLIRVKLSDSSMLTTKKLVIATGGSSYPATGSDGSFFNILERDLGLSIVSPKPALAPVYVQDFAYEDLAGVSFDDISVSCGKHSFRGAALMTHRGFSGPAMLHISEYVKPGDELVINYCPDMDEESMLEKIRLDQPSSALGLGNYFTSLTGLPKSFVNRIVNSPERRLSSVSMSELRGIVSHITHFCYSVSGTGGWNDAMVTSGGVSLDQIDLKTMRLKTGPASDIRIIGEALDVNGESGGYNLQFAYSSAMAALEK